VNVALETVSDHIRGAPDRDIYEALRGGGTPHTPELVGSPDRSGSQVLGRRTQSQRAPMTS